MKFVYIAAAAAALSGCVANTANTPMIARESSNPYAGMPCTAWGLVAEQSMLGYQLQMGPMEVLKDIGPSLPKSADISTLKLVMSGVAQYDFQKDDAMQQSMARTYADLVKEECAAVRR